MREILKQPLDNTMERIVGAVNLINNETYVGLRAGNVIGTSEGYTVKISEVEDRSVFAGFLGSCRILEKFMVLSPQISGGVLDMRDSDIVRYVIDGKDENVLIKVLENVGIRQ